jgi:hypothetical protein
VRGAARGGGSGQRSAGRWQQGSGGRSAAPARRGACDQRGPARCSARCPSPTPPPPRYLTLAQAQAKKFTVDWADPVNRPVKPRLLGTQVFENFPITDVVDYIDWNPFFQVGCLQGSEAWREAWGPAGTEGGGEAVWGGRRFCGALLGAAPPAAAPAAARGPAMAPPRLHTRPRSRSRHPVPSRPPCP